MKNYALLSKLTCTVVCLSPLILTGCQVMDGFFGGGSSYQGQDPYRYSNTRASQQRAVSNSSSQPSSSSSSSSRTATSTVKKTGASSAAVPVEPPSVHKGTASVPNTSPSESSSNVPANNSVTVPAAPTGAPVTAPTMLAPDANQ